MLHEIGLKGCFIQIGVEIIDQRLELRIVMIVTDSIARLLPDVFLGIQRRASGREVPPFQGWVLGQDLIQGRP